MAAPNPLIDEETIWKRVEEELKKGNSQIYEQLQELKEKFPTNDFSSLAKQVNKQTKREKDRMENSQWTWPRALRKDKKKIRDSTAEIASAAQNIRKVVGGLVELDTTGFVKLGWLPFNILLGGLSLAVENYTKALGAFTTITVVIYEQGRIFEAYRKTGTRNEVLEESMIQLYSKVLMLEVMLYKHFQRNAVKQALRSIPGLDDWEATLQEMEERRKYCKDIYKTEMDDLLVDIAQSLKKTQESIQADIDKRKQEVERSVVGALGKDPLPDHTAVLDETGIGTDYPRAGEWLLKNDGSFNTWSTSIAGFSAFWLHGPVGTGKTCLTTLAIEHSANKSFQDKQEKLAYFYCSKVGGQDPKPGEVLNSLIRQLCWSSENEGWNRHLDDSWKAIFSGSSHTFNQSKDALKAVLLGNTTTIIIDALDVCSAPGDLLSVFRELVDATDQPYKCLRLFVSSRENIAVDNYFPNSDSGRYSFFPIQVTPQVVEADVRRFVKGYVSIKCDAEYGAHSLGNSEHATRRANLEKVLIEHTGSCFQWTVLRLGIFFPSKPRAFDSTDFDKRIELLSDPSENSENFHSNKKLNTAYTDVYKENVGDLDSTLGQNTRRALQWLVGCGSTYTPSFGLIDCIDTNLNLTDTPGIKLLVDAIRSHHPDETDMETYIRQATSNLLSVRQTGEVRFAHPSVLQFLQEDRMFGGAFSDDEAKISITETCLCALTRLEATTLPPPTNSVREGNWPLLGPEIESRCDSFNDYVLAMWPVLCKKIGKMHRSQDRIASKLKDILLVSPQVHDSLFQKWLAWIESVNRDGFPRYSEFIVESEFLKVLSSTRDPFFLSCLLGFEEIVKMIADARPNVLCLKTKGMDGLYLAICSHDEATARVLIEKNASLNGDQRRNKFIASATHDMLNTVMFMVEKGAHLDQQDEYGCTALYYAVTRCHREIADYLLECGASYGDVLVQAAGNIESYIPDRLIRDASPEQLRSALGCALGARRRSSMNKALVPWLGADQPSLVRRLLDAGAPTVFHEGRLTETAMGLAISEGDDGLIDLFKSRESRLRPHPDELLFAWERQYKDEVKQLLNADVPLTPDITRWYLREAEIKGGRWADVKGILHERLGREVDGVEKEPKYERQDASDSPYTSDMDSLDGLDGI